MCGIVAYTGRREATEFLVEGLRRLEYRGYDSAGLAVLDDSVEITTCKTVGRIKSLSEPGAAALFEEPTSSPEPPKQEEIVESSLVPASSVVAGIRVTRVRAGMTRVTVELNRPATPRIDHVTESGQKYLRLSYVK